jgi:hypothetical protein
MRACLQDRLGVDVSLAGVTSSSKMLLDESKLSLATWHESFSSASTSADMAAFSQHFAQLDSDAVIFDCTAGDEPCEFYQDWLASGVHVITPNKKLHSGPLQRYKAVRRLQAEGKAHYFYEVSEHDYLHASTEHRALAGKRLHDALYCYKWHQEQPSRSHWEPILCRHHVGQGCRC